MADPKKIELEIAATGGDQAAAEVGKVAKATEALAETKGPVTGFGGMLDGVPERAEAAAEAVTKVGKSAADARAEAQKASSTFGEMAGNMENASGKAADLDDNLGKISRAQRAQALAQLAEAMGRVGKSVRETADDIRTADPEMARSLDRMADGIDQVSSKAQAMALGFAAGGPVGAGLALVATLTADAGVGLVNMGAALDAAAAAEARAEEMQTRLNLALAGVRDPAAEAATASQELSNRYTQETEALRGANAELDRRNKLLDAQAAEKSAERDLKDQREIQGGAAPEDVRAKRAQDDADAQKALIDEKLNNEAQLLNGRFETIQRGRGVLEADQRSGSQSPEQLTKRENELKAAEQKLEQDLANFKNEQAIAESRKRGIDNRTTATVEDLGVRKIARLKTESKTAAQKAAAEERERKQASEQKADAEERRRNAGRDLETDITGLGADAAEATRGIGARGINPEGFNALAAKIAKKGNPDQDKADLSTFLSKIGQLVDNIPDSKSGGIDAQTLREVERKLEKKIEILTNQMRGK